MKATLIDTLPERLKIEIDARNQAVNLPRLYYPATYQAALGYENGEQYHSIAHAREVVDDIITECHKHDNLDEQDVQDVYLAGWWHDYKYAEPLDKTRFASKEKRSAADAFRAIRECGKLLTLPEQFSIFQRAGNVAALIESTEASVQIRNDVLKRILNFCDLGNLRGTPMDVSLKSARFFLEYLRDSGEEKCETLSEAVMQHQDQLPTWCANAKQSLEALLVNKGLGSLRGALPYVAPEYVIEAVQENDRQVR